MSDFGELEIVPNYVMAGSTNVFLLNPEYGDMAYLRSFQSTPLGKTGDSMKEQVIVDATVRVTSELAQSKLADLTGG